MGGGYERESNPSGRRGETGKRLEKEVMPRRGK
jgi:hypothetical protein